MRRRWWRNFVVMVLLAVLVVGGLRSWRAHAAPTGPFAVRTEGSFAAAGEFPITAPPPGRHWESRGGSVANTGTLVLGPFPCPSKLRVAVSGYPHASGNDLYLEMTFLGIRLPLEFGVVGERWETKEFDVPPGWQGWQVTLVAVDNAKDANGWLGVSEPLPPAGGSRLGTGLAAALAAWAVNGLLLGLLFVAAAGWLEAKQFVPGEWTALVAGAVVALLGYGLFWVYCASAVAGHVLALTLLALAALRCVLGRSAERAAAGEWKRVTTLMVCVGGLYLALLYLYSAPWGFYELAANRFVPGLPGDNRLPQDLAVQVYEGRAPKAFDADWLSSDRPPLQSGWELLTWRADALLGFEPTLATAATAVWLQLLWIPGVYGLLRVLRLAERTAFGLTAALGLSGFLLVNTVFTWPKLCAAAFVFGAFGLAFAPTGRTTRGFALAVTLAVTGWLSHAGVAFSLVPLVVLFATRAWQLGRAGWVLAAGVALLVAGPWIIYQKFYDPPGDRLLKWHLAGQTVKDDARGLGRTLRENYAARGWTKAAAARRDNLEAQLPRNWSWVHDFSFARAQDRRADEFFHQVHTLNWWLLGIAALPFAVHRRKLAAGAGAYGALAGWTMASFALWILLLFSPGAAIVHQGSYAMTLGASVLLAVALWCASPVLFAVVFALQSAQFWANYLAPSSVVKGRLDPAAIVLGVAALVGGVWLVWQNRKRDAGAATFESESALKAG